MADQTPRRQLHRRRYPELNDEAWLRRKHHDDGLAVAAIAEELGCSPAGARAALARAGLYRPQRRTQVRVLTWVTRQRMLDDAKTVASWWALGKLYGAQSSVVHTHALHLGIHEQVQAALRPAARRAPDPLPPNPLLESRDWIATTWARTYSMTSVARDALVTSRMLYRWLRLHGMSAAEVREARDRAIVIEYESGATLRQVSDWHAIDGAAVWRILRRAGVDTSPGRYRPPYPGYETWIQRTRRT